MNCKIEKNKYYKELPQEYLQKVLNYEGGLCNDPYDKGGKTNRGICSSTLLNAKQKGLIPYSVTIESLTTDLESCRKIYENLYYLRNKCDKIPAMLSFCVFDCSVNNGLGAARKIASKNHKYIFN